jgi:sodium transport system permease protein
VVALYLRPLFGPLLFGGMLQFTIDRTSREIDLTVPVSVINAQGAPNLIAHLAQRGVVITEVALDDAGARAAVRDRTARMVLEVPKDMATQLEGGEPVGLPCTWTPPTATTALRRAGCADSSRSIRRASSRSASSLRGVDPAAHGARGAPGRGRRTPASRSVLIIGMLSFFLILAVMTGGMYLAMDTTVGETRARHAGALLATATSRESLIARQDDGHVRRSWRSRWCSPPRASSSCSGALTSSRSA